MRMLIGLTVYNIVVHNTALNSSDNLPSYRSSSRLSSDDIYCNKALKVWQQHH